ncbi:phage head closure protein [Shinella sp. BYT-45]|uniref:phage head closure protein n=1 Tax=Shinella sp. BYT-45 TaxID=3377377 RepID=UPI0039814E3F
MTTGSNLDRRIVIERSTRTPNGYGGFVYVWAELATVAASRHDVSDSERFAYGGIVSDTLRRFVIRAIGPQAGVRSDDRLLYGGMVWNIVGVKETRDGRNRFLEITAKAEN